MFWTRTEDRVYRVICDRSLNPSDNCRGNRRGGLGRSDSDSRQPKTEDVTKVYPGDRTWTYEEDGDQFGNHESGSHDGVGKTIQVGESLVQEGTLSFRLKFEVVRGILRGIEVIGLLRQRRRGVPSGPSRRWRRGIQRKRTTQCREERYKR